MGCDKRRAQGERFVLLTGGVLLNVLYGCIPYVVVVFMTIVTPWFTGVDYAAFRRLRTSLWHGIPIGHTRFGTVAVYVFHKAALKAVVLIGTDKMHFSV